MIQYPACYIISGGVDVSLISAYRNKAFNVQDACSAIRTSNNSLFEYLDN
jgi:hypothetical protein